MSSLLYRLRTTRVATLGFVAVAALAACGGGGRLVPASPNAAGPASADRAPSQERFKDMTTGLAINSGGDTVSTFFRDNSYSGGTALSYTANVDTSNIDDPAPQAVYHTERDGNFTYTFRGVPVDQTYVVRLHFDEPLYTAPGQRIFNVSINGTPALTNFDIFALARAQNVAFTVLLSVRPTASGVIAIQFTSVKNQAKVNAIEIGRLNALTGAPVYVAAGSNAAVGQFVSDDDFNSGLPHYNGQPQIDESGVTNPPPAAVFYNERYGNTFTYQFSGLEPGSPYNLRLDFVEPIYNAAGQRLFDVTLNGTRVLTNYDIFADAGARYKATAKTFATNADPNGRITVGFNNVYHYALVNGLELTAQSQATPPPFSSKIQHVVVVIQENRSFDNLFNGFPGADTAQSGINSKGEIVPLAAVPLEAGHDPGHIHAAFKAAYDHGKNDGFDLEGYDKNPSDKPNYQYANVPPQETADYFAFGEQYAVGDRMFQSNSGPSYPAHQYLIAGQSANVSSVPNKKPWGCDAPPGTFTFVTLPSNPSEGALQDTTTKGPFPCFDYQTLGDLMDAKGVTWAFYAPAYNLGAYQWSAYDAIRHIRYGPDWTNNVLSPETTILSDIQNNNLRQVSYVVPDFANSDHAIAGSNTGPAWVSSIIDAVGNSPYWSSTAVIVTWDDWGGWFDHVVPPQLDAMGLGFRVPILIVSPYVKGHYVSHVQHEFGSIVKFIEETYGLPSLGQTDVRSDDLSDFFDLSQPVMPFARIHTAAQSRRNIDRFLREVPSHIAPDDD